MADFDYDPTEPDPEDDAEDAAAESGDEGVDEAGDENGAPRAVFVSTGVPVQVQVAALPDERAPDGSCLASYIDGRLVARCVMPSEAIDRLLELDLFGQPVPLGLLAYEEEPGLQCRLIALVPADALSQEEGESESEPWRASVPSYEAALAASEEEEDEDDETGEDDGEDEDETALAPILLGHIVRFASDRKFPDDLAQEAVDVLMKVVTGGPLSDASRKAIDDLLDSL